MSVLSKSRLTPSWADTRAPDDPAGRRAAARTAAARALGLCLDMIGAEDHTLIDRADMERRICHLLDTAHPDPQLLQTGLLETASEPIARKLVAVCPRAEWEAFIASHPRDMPRARCAAAPLSLLHFLVDIGLGCAVRHAVPGTLLACDCPGRIALLEQRLGLPASRIAPEALAAALVGDTPESDRPGPNLRAHVLDWIDPLATLPPEALRSLLGCALSHAKMRWPLILLVHSGGQIFPAPRSRVDSPAGAALVDLARSAHGRLRLIATLPEPPTLMEMDDSDLAALVLAA